MINSLTTFCTVCGWVGYEDEAAGHPCNPRRVTELEHRVADLERQLGDALNAWEIAAGIEGTPEVIVPAQRPDLRLAYSRQDAKSFHPSNRAARPSPCASGDIERCRRGRLHRKEHVMNPGTWAVTSSGTVVRAEVADAPWNWRDFAACADTDPEAFFPEEGANRFTTASVRRICRGCPVRGECLEFALANPEDTRYGIWAGMPRKELQAERRRRRQAVA